jgi:hypothetical protein
MASMTRTSARSVRGWRSRSMPRLGPAENLEFAECFTDEHRETFDRLAR